MIAGHRRAASVWAASDGTSLDGNLIGTDRTGRRARERRGGTCARRQRRGDDRPGQHDRRQRERGVEIDRPRTADSPTRSTGTATRASSSTPARTTTCRASDRSHDGGWHVDGARHLPEIRTHGLHRRLRIPTCDPNGGGRTTSAPIPQQPTETGRLSSRSPPRQARARRSSRRPSPTPTLNTSEFSNCLVVAGARSREPSPAGEPGHRPDRSTAPRTGRSGATSRDRTCRERAHPEPGQGERRPPDQRPLPDEPERDAAARLRLRLAVGALRLRLVGRNLDGLDDGGERRHHRAAGRGRASRSPSRRTRPANADDLDVRPLRGRDAHRDISPTAAPALHLHAECVRRSVPEPGRERAGSLHAPVRAASAGQHLTVTWTADGEQQLSGCCDDVVHLRRRALRPASTATGATTQPHERAAQSPISGSNDAITTSR